MQILNKKIVDCNEYFENNLVKFNLLTKWFVSMIHFGRKLVCVVTKEDDTSEI